MIRPRLSYWICWSARRGGTLLHQTLASTGVIGDPTEWFWPPEVEASSRRWGIEGNFTAYVERVFEVATTPNGVFGVRLSPGIHLSGFLEKLRAEPRWADPDLTDREIVESLFPDLRFIWVTRRDKIRQAVSWWKAAQTGIWGLKKGAETPRPEREPRYLYEAIDHLVKVVVFADCRWQEWFAAWGATPLTLVYEDFVQDLEGTAHAVIDYLGVDDPWELDESRIVAAVQADACSEEWVQRYREESQEDWARPAW